MSTKANLECAEVILERNRIYGHGWERLRRDIAAAIDLAEKLKDAETRKLIQYFEDKLAAQTTAVAEERERCAKIADSHYVDHRGHMVHGLIHNGQCHQAIAEAIRKGEGEAGKDG